MIFLYNDCGIRRKAQNWGLILLAWSYGCPQGLAWMRGQIFFVLRSDLIDKASEIVIIYFLLFRGLVGFFGFFFCCRFRFCGGSRQLLWKSHLKFFPKDI